MIGIGAAAESGQRVWRPITWVDLSGANFTENDSLTTKVDYAAVKRSINAPR